MRPRWASPQARARSGTWTFPTRTTAAPGSTTCSTTVTSSPRVSSSHSEERPLGTANNGGAAMKALIRTTAAAMLFAQAAWGAVSPQDAARLGAELTPLGGEKAANADGSIPAWNGGIKSIADAGVSGYHPGDHHPDPYASDKPLFTITSANMAQYAAKLTEGHKALFKSYPDYKMVVYPTHRSAAVPERVYEATKRNATSAKLVTDGNGFTGAVGGTPFPIPQAGVEVFWNHVTRFRGV